MAQIKDLIGRLEKGRVYWRRDLIVGLGIADRAISALVANGVLTKLYRGLYYHPKQSIFGAVPAEECHLLQMFLRTDKFLVFTPNMYNGLGLGTTQLYNLCCVYSNKRHGDIKLGGRTFRFRRKKFFPDKLTKEFLLVDMVNNLEILSEEKQTILERLPAKAASMNRTELIEAVRQYGGAAARKLFAGFI